MGQRLQAARRQAGLTQQELCQKAGLSYSTLAKIERGAIKAPSIFTVAAIAEATNHTMEALLDMKPGGSGGTKKTSKTGVKFVYFDINNVLVRFFSQAFGEIARVSGHPVDMVEALYWRYNDEVNCGRASLEDLNAAFEGEFGLKDFDWQKHYLAAVEPMPGMDKLVRWTAQHFEVGLMSNNMPGFIDKLLAKKLLPDVGYKAVIDSSEAGCIKPEAEIYNIAQEKAGVEAKEILLVDDTRPFLTAADRLGWQIIWFNEFEPAESIKRVQKYLEF